jgi:hypothetical protein
MHSKYVPTARAWLEREIGDLRHALDLIVPAPPAPDLIAELCAALERRINLKCDDDDGVVEDRALIARARKEGA